MASHHRFYRRFKTKYFPFLKNPKKATRMSLKTREIRRKRARLIFTLSSRFDPLFLENQKVTQWSESQLFEKS